MAPPALPSITTWLAVAAGWTCAIVTVLMQHGYWNRWIGRREITEKMLSDNITTAHARVDELKSRMDGFETRERDCREHLVREIGSVREEVRVLVSEVANLRQGQETTWKKLDSLSEQIGKVGKRGEE